MIGVLAYVSPLAFMTVASDDTSDFCKNYVKSFIGQCAVMIVSVWTVNIVLSGFSFIGEDNVFFRLIATYAICKIAQKLDTYMQGWGAGTLTTGQNLLDAGLTAAGALGFGKRNNQKSSPETSGSSTPKVGGVIGGLSGAIRGAKSAYVQGGSAKEVRKAAKTSFMKGAGLGGVERNIEKRKNGEEVTLKDKAAAVGLVLGSGPVTNKAEKIGAERRESLDRKSLNTGEGFIEGSAAIGKYAAENYAELSAPENKELNEATVEAVKNDPVAAQSMMESDVDFTGNDKLGGAAIKSAFDLPPELSEGEISNVTKTSVEGGGYRTDFTYATTEGENRTEKSVTMYSRKAFNNLPLEEQVDQGGEKIRTGRTKDNHETAYFRIRETKPVNTQNAKPEISLGQDKNPLEETGRKTDLQEM